MFRRFSLVLVALTLVACNNCKANCSEGITFYVAEVAGALSRGGTEPLHVCFDGDCKDVTVTRENAGGTVFLKFGGVGKNVDHDLTVTGIGSFKGKYKGKIASYNQDPGGSCSTCALATVKIGADGAITPGAPAPTATTTTIGAVAPTTTAAP
ncbi:MAG: hypothetical protein ACXWBO_00330 [Ilumatobacteraceae bacterium]